MIEEHIWDRSGTMDSMDSMDRGWPGRLKNMGRTGKRETSSTGHGPMAGSRL